MTSRLLGNFLNLLAPFPKLQKPLWSMWDSKSTFSPTYRDPQVQQLPQLHSSMSTALWPVPGGGHFIRGNSLYPTSPLLSRGLICSLITPQALCPAKSSKPLSYYVFDKENHFFFFSPILTYSSVESGWKQDALCSFEYT